MLRGRIISARVLLLRRRGSRTIGCSVWSVMRPATWDMLYCVLSCVLQSDALVVAVVCRVVDWWREDWRCWLIGRKLTVGRSRVDGIALHAGLRA